MNRGIGEKAVYGIRIEFLVRLVVLLLLGGLLLPGPVSRAGSVAEGGEMISLESRSESLKYENPDTYYCIFVDDYAGLLTEIQIRDLVLEMQKITPYGNAAFLTVDTNDLSTENLARDYYSRLFGTDSGTVFVIDMDNRNIWIHSDGDIYGVVTASYADTVTDNVYRYASDGAYYDCAKEAFRQIQALLEGQRIAQPMKYISNALLAMILALLIHFGLVICFTRLGKPGRSHILANVHRKFVYTKPEAVYTHQTKLYDPVSSESGGGGGGSSGGGGGSGGGGSSGGGGGHSF